MFVWLCAKTTLNQRHLSSDLEPLIHYIHLHFIRWRIIDDEELEQALMLEEDQCEASGEVIDENITDECMATIHDKAMLDERKKFETYLKFPLTSRSRANRRIDSRGNESSGANTPTPDATSPAPLHGDLEVSFFFNLIKFFLIFNLNF